MNFYAIEGDKIAVCFDKDSYAAGNGVKYRNVNKLFDDFAMSTEQLYGGGMMVQYSVGNDNMYKILDILESTGFKSCDNVDSAKKQCVKQMINDKAGADRPR